MEIDVPSIMKTMAATPSSDAIEAKSEAYQFFGVKTNKAEKTKSLEEASADLEIKKLSEYVYNARSACNAQTNKPLISFFFF